jgi:CRISPR/Cas system-associated exonuclease Cas4 (RecB family)
VVEIDDRNVRRTLDRMEALLGAVEGDDTLAPRTGDHCRQCDYAAYCPSRTAQPLPLPSAAPVGQLSLGL